MTYDSATSKEVGAPAREETEVTPEMIAAGLDALTSRYQDLVAPEVDAYPEIVRTVYRAMTAVRV